MSTASGGKLRKIFCEYHQILFQERPLTIFRYANVRIDAVHFCGEFELGGASRKKSRSAGRRARDEGDPARQRLILFSRTVREQSRLAQRVITLRIPFTTRETCKADLARAVSNLHQLRYVDLPEAVFSSPSSNVLKIELQAACPELCSLKFTSGSDATFEMLGQGRLFPRLENITLCDLGVDANVLVLILVGLPALSTLHVSGLPQLNDRALSAGVHLPALHMLELSHMPHLTVDGMAAYVSRPEVGKMLKRLILSDTAISVADIYKILNLSENLETLHITQTVSRPLPFQLPPLVSSSLKRLHFAISTASKQSHNMTSPSESYYTYLRNSVLDGHLPSLIHLYALSTGLPSMLQQQSRHFRPSHPFFLYTKSVAELEWDLTVIDPAAVTSTKSETRPLSLYNPPAPSTFGNQTSLMTDDGFGGEHLSFLIVI